MGARGGVRDRLRDRQQGRVGRRVRLFARARGVMRLVHGAVRVAQQSGQRVHTGLRVVAMMCCGVLFCVGQHRGARQLGMQLQQQMAVELEPKAGRQRTTVAGHAAHYRLRGSEQD